MERGGDSDSVCSLQLVVGIWYLDLDSYEFSVEFEVTRYECD
mgnify:FL=1